MKISRASAETASMRRVALYSIHNPQVWLRQIPGREPAWGGTSFLIETGADDCDLLVVYDTLNAPLDVLVPRDRRIVFLTEPPQGTTYDINYLRQFGLIVAPYPISVPGARVIESHSALPWFVGITFEGPNLTINLDYDALAVLPPPPAPECKLTVVTSANSKLPQQKQRLALIAAVKAALGDDLIVFGRGVRPVGDKMEALYGCDFHLVLENNREPHFWTEKLADSFLAWSHPIYVGAPRAAEDFPARAMTPITVTDVATAARTVAARVRQGLDANDRAALAEGRRILMREHNLFAMLDRLASSVPLSPPLPRPEVIRPDTRKNANSAMKRVERTLRRLRFWKMAH